MIQFYVEKIQTKTMNPNTGEAWTIEDVPRLWRSKVQKALE